MCRDKVSDGLKPLHLPLPLCLNRLMDGAEKTFETVPQGVDVLHRSQRRLGELRPGVAKIANYVDVCLDLKKTLKNELLNLLHERGKSPSTMFFFCMMLPSWNWEKCLLT